MLNDSKGLDFPGSGALSLGRERFGRERFGRERLDFPGPGALTKPRQCPDKPKTNVAGARHGMPQGHGFRKAVTRRA